MAYWTVSAGVFSTTVIGGGKSVVLSGGVMVVDSIDVSGVGTTGVVVSINGSSD